MTPQEFVDALRGVIKRDAVDGVLGVLARPPGRRPSPELVAASRWYLALDKTSQEMVANVMAMTARHALFSVLSVLDGARPVEPLGEKSTFQLVMRKDAQEWPLAGPDTPALHELLGPE